MIAIALPGRGAPAGDGSFDRLLDRAEGVVLSRQEAMAVTIGFGSGRTHAIGIRPDADCAAPAPGLTLATRPASDAAPLLERHWRALDHVGLNLAVADLDKGGWAALIADAAAAMPAYRLRLDSPNEIVMLVGDGAVIELVRDATGPTGIHLCGSSDASRAALEDAWPSPWGGYKPGDEAFFRSVRLASSLLIPAYVDLAFADGGMAPWPTIVAAMGDRIGAG